MSRIVESLYEKYGLNEKVNIDNDDIIETTLEWSVYKDELEAGIKELEQKGIKVLNVNQPDEDWLDFDIDIRGKKSVICNELIKEYGSKEEAEELYPELFDDYLNEARNPENDEVNAILKNKIAKAKHHKNENLNEEFTEDELKSFENNDVNPNSPTPYKDYILAVFHDIDVDQDAVLTELLKLVSEEEIKNICNKFTLFSDRFTYPD